MKSLYLKLFALVIISLSVFVPLVHAEDLSHEPVIVTLAKTETVNHDYFAAGDTVHVSGTVNGDAYVAGSTVIVDGTINGDLLTAGATVTVMGTVKNDIRAAGGTVTIEGPVGGNVTVGAGTLLIGTTAKIPGSLVAGAGTMNVMTNIGKGMTAGAGNLTLNGKVGGDMTVGAQNMTFEQNTVVKGNISYWSEQPLTLSNGATVAGTLTYHELPKSEKRPSQVAEETAKTVKHVMTTFFATAAVVGFVLLFLAGLLFQKALPEFSKMTTTFARKNLLLSFGIGFITFFVTPIILLFLFVSVIGIPVALFLIAMLVLLCVVGHIVGALTIGNMIFGGEKTTTHPALQLFVGLLLLGVLTFIPVLGWLTRGFILTMSVGALLHEKYTLYHTLRTKKLI